MAIINQAIINPSVTERVATFCNQHKYKIVTAVGAVGLVATGGTLAAVYLGVIGTIATYALTASLVGTATAGIVGAIAAHRSSRRNQYALIQQRPLPAQQAPLLPQMLQQASTGTTAAVPAPAQNAEAAPLVAAPTTSKVSSFKKFSGPVVLIATTTLAIASTAAAVYLLGMSAPIVALAATVSIVALGVFMGINYLMCGDLKKFGREIELQQIAQNITIPVQTPVTNSQPQAETQPVDPARTRAMEIVNRAFALGSDTAPAAPVAVPAPAAPVNPAPAPVVVASAKVLTQVDQDWLNANKLEFVNGIPPVVVTPDLENPTPEENVASSTPTKRSLFNIVHTVALAAAVIALVVPTFVVSRMPNQTQSA